MKFQRARRFESDWARLSDSERALFRAVIHEQFHPACTRLAVDPATRWPTSLRVKSVQGQPGVFEMTWSFSGPDGRATFEWIEIDGERAIRWRRIGGHVIFREP